jgi:uncharacterized protein with NRDE domain
MCVIYFALKQNPSHPFLLLANRDEFYDRPSQAAKYWEDFPDIYAGRDLVRNGTWLGVDRAGRFAAVTNFRDPTARVGERSRGELVADYLKRNIEPKDYLVEVEQIAGRHSGFNLLVGGVTDVKAEVFYYSNRGGPPRQLSPGVYGLSNHLLDTPWPKVVKGKDRLSEVLRREDVTSTELFEILSDETTAGDDELPSTGIAFDAEKALSAVLIKTPGYGTRCSTVLSFSPDGKWSFEERTYK